MKEHSFHDGIYKRLTKAGFQVIKKYIGSTIPKSQVRSHSRNGGRKNPTLPYFRINTTNNETLINAIKQTNTKMNKDGFGKDKSKELIKTFRQEEAPHGTDAMDIVIFGLYGKK